MEILNEHFHVAGKKLLSVWDKINCISHTWSFFALKQTIRKKYLEREWKVSNSWFPSISSTGRTKVRSWLREIRSGGHFPPQRNRYAFSCGGCCEEEGISHQKHCNSATLPRNASKFDSVYTNWADLLEWYVGAQYALKSVWHILLYFTLRLRRGRVNLTESTVSQSVCVQFQRKLARFIAREHIQISIKKNLLNS